MSVSFHQLWLRTLRQLTVAEDAKPTGYVLIGFHEAAEVAAEAVLVELVVGFHVPQAAGVRADFVGEHDAHHLALIEAAEFQLEIYEADADAQEKTGKEVVDPDGQCHDVVDFLGGGPAEGRHMLFGNHGIAQLIILVIELDDRAGQGRAFGQPQPLGERARGNIAHDDLERNDLHGADQLLAHVQALQEMGRHANVVELGKDQLGNAIVENPFAVDDFLFLIVEGRRIILVMDDQGAGLGTFVKDLGLALVDTGAALVHVFRPSSNLIRPPGPLRDPAVVKAGISRRFQSPIASSMRRIVELPGRNNLVRPLQMKGSTGPVQYAICRMVRRLWTVSAVDLTGGRGYLCAQASIRSDFKEQLPYDDVRQAKRGLRKQVCT